jgi:hypothetical protein
MRVASRGPLRLHPACRQLGRSRSERDIATPIHKAKDPRVLAEMATPLAFHEGDRKSAEHQVKQLNSKDGFRWTRPRAKVNLAHRPLSRYAPAQPGKVLGVESGCGDCSQLVVLCRSSELGSVEVKDLGSCLARGAGGSTASSPFFASLLFPLPPYLNVFPI